MIYFYSVQERGGGREGHWMTRQLSHTHNSLSLSLI
jgi:hypothetical protein